MVRPALPPGRTATIVKDDTAPLTSKQVDALIATFDSPIQSMNARPGGPPTTPTDATRILAGHLHESRSALVQALGSRNNNIRRLAAFTLGSTGDASLMPELADAMDRELRTGIPQSYTDSGIRDDHYFAALRAIVVAYCRLGRAPAMTKYLRERHFEDFQAVALNDALSRAVLTTADCREPSRHPQECIQNWVTTLDAHSSDSRLFEWDP